MIHVSISTSSLIGKQRQVVAACQKALLGRGQRAYIMLPSPPRNITFQRPVTTAGLLTQQCYYYTFPGTAVQEGRPSHPLRHFLQKTACFHVQDGGLPSSAPSGGSDFASGNSWYYPGCGRAGLQPDGAFLQSGSPCRWCQCALQSPGGWPRGQRPGRRRLVSIVGCIFVRSPPEWRGHPAQRCSKWWF